MRKSRRVLLFVLLATGLGLAAWRNQRGKQGMPLAVVAGGPEAGMVRAVGLPAKRFEIETTGAGGRTGVTTFKPAPGWGLALFMLPEGGAWPNNDAGRGPAALGWFADGTPVAAHRFQADRIAGHDAFGVDAVRLKTPQGPFAWQLVPVPPQAPGASISILAWNATAADIVAAIPSPLPTRMTETQARTLLEVVGGDVGEFNQLHHGRDDATRAALRAYSDAVITRARAVAPALAGLADGGIQILRLNVGSAAGGSAVQVQLAPIPPGDAAGADVQARATWLMSAVEPAKYDAPAMALLNGSGPAISIYQALVRSGHAPTGAGAALARRFLADGAGRSGRVQDDRGFSREVGLIVLDLVSRSSLGAEADAFVATFAASAVPQVRAAIATNIAGHLTSDWPSPGLGSPAPASVDAVIARVGALEPAALRQDVAAALQFQFSRLFQVKDGVLHRAGPDNPDTRP